MIKIGHKINELYNTPVNRRLKYCSLTAICISIALIFIMIIWMGDISYRGTLIMRGCAGLGAIISVILYGCLIYRVNREYIKGRYNKNQGNKH